MRSASNNVSVPRAWCTGTYLYTLCVKPGTSISRARRALTLLNAPLDRNDRDPRNLHMRTTYMYKGKQITRYLHVKNEAVCIKTPSFSLGQ